jgi:pilus assembly protein TadC
MTGVDEGWLKGDERDMPLGVELLVTIAVLVVLLGVINAKVLGVFWWKKMNIDTIIGQLILVLVLIGVAVNIVRLL